MQLVKTTLVEGDAMAVIIW